MSTGSFKLFVSACAKDAPIYLACLLALLLAAGGAYTLALGDTLRYWDEEHYLLLARNLHQGIYSFDGKTPTAFQPPGYPLFLYLLSTIWNNLTFLRFGNYLLLAGSIALLFRMLKEEEGATAALLGAAMCSFYPLFFYTAGTFYPQILASTLFLLILTLILQMDTPSWKRELSIGALLGYLALTIPSYLLYMPLWAAYPWFVNTQKKWRAVFLLAAGCALIVGAWTARNIIAFHRVVPISTNSGVNLLLGNSDATTPESGVNVDLDKYLAKGERLDEFEQDAYYRSAALAWIGDHPWAAFKLYLLKSANFFNYKNELASKHEESPAREMLSFISYYPVLLLALLRLLWGIRYPLKRFEWYFALFLLCSPFLHAIFFTRIRFRIPFDFIAIYFAASTLQLIVQRLNGNEGTPSPSGR